MIEQREIMKILWLIIKEQIVINKKLEDRLRSVERKNKKIGPSTGLNESSGIKRGLDKMEYLHKNLTKSFVAKNPNQSDEEVEKMMAEYEEQYYPTIEEEKDFFPKIEELVKHVQNLNLQNKAWEQLNS